MTAPNPMRRRTIEDLTDQGMSARDIANQMGEKIKTVERYRSFYRARTGKPPIRGVKRLPRETRPTPASIAADIASGKRCGAPGGRLGPCPSLRPCYTHGTA